MKEGLNTTMGVNIIIIPDLTKLDIEDWKNGKMYIDIEDHELYTPELVEQFYQEFSKDNKDVSFPNWCKSNGLFTINTLSRYFGIDNCEWETIKHSDGMELIIAVKD